MKNLLKGYSRFYAELKNDKGEVVTNITQIVKGETEEEVLETLKENNIYIDEFYNVIISKAYVFD